MTRRRGRREGGTAAWAGWGVTNCRSTWVALILAATTLAAGSTAQAKCEVHKVADLPVTMEGPSAIAKFKVNGVDARFVVDTGAFFSIVTPDAAKRMKVEDIGLRPITVTGLGGQEQMEVGEARVFTFADVPLRHIEFIIGGREFRRGVVGLLGENILGVFDMEYDFANGMIRLLHPRDCADADIGYWMPGATDRIRIDPPNGLDTRIRGKAQVNGKVINFELDSGSASSVLSLRAAERAGIRPGGPGVVAAGLSSGIGRGVVETWIAPVDNFAIGSEQIKNTRLQIGKLDFSDDVDMLLGADFFLSHRMLVSWSQRQLYFSYNGGSVFRLDQASDANAGGPAPAAQTEPSSVETPPADAEGWARKGAALLARRKYDDAVEAFTHAIELDPKSANRFLQRAQARWWAGRPTLAMSDYDRAIELEPGNAEARLQRGDLYLQNGDLAQAQKDFDAVKKAAPGDAGVRRRIGALFEGRGRYDLAIPEYDAAIALNPKDELIWRAFNASCWARAMLGKELDKAMADCDAALRRGPRNSQVLDSRGMVHLRRGELKEAIADYDAALKLQPKLPWSLYGRGLAKRRLGLTAEGDADRAAALALQPNLTELAKTYGIVEAPVQDKAAPGGATTPATAPKP